MLISMATALRYRLHDAKEIHHNIKQMEHLTSLLSLASLPKDTSALLQVLINCSTRKTCQ
jgi:hypothetical protein